MGSHSHDFVNSFDCSSIVFGMSRELDEKSLIAYLQKFTDDKLMELLVTRLSDDEIKELVDFVTKILRSHLSADEYHTLFLADR